MKPGEVRDGQARMRHEHLRRPHQQRHRGQVLHGIIGKVRIERLGGGQGRVDRNAERVPVRGLGHRVGADGAARAGPVLHHEGLAERRGEVRRHGAARGVGRGARRDRHDDAHRPVRPAGGLGPGRPGRGQGGNGGGGGAQGEERAARQLHVQIDLVLVSARACSMEATAPSSANGLRPRVRLGFRGHRPRSGRRSFLTRMCEPGPAGTAYVAFATWNDARPGHRRRRRRARGPGRCR